jgi:hypothetical protein
MILDIQYTEQESTILDIQYREQESMILDKQYTEQKSVILDIRGCIQKFPDWVDNEINNNKHSSRSNTNGYDSKTQ